MSLQLRIFITLILTAILLSLGSAVVFSQNNQPDFRFQAIGDLSPAIRPDEEIKIIVVAEADAPGTLSLKIVGTRYSFLQGWEDKQIDCSNDCVLSDTLHIIPTQSDYGVYDFSVAGQYFSAGNLIQEQRLPIALRVIPKMIAEPPFNPGLSNQLCWAPFEENFRHEVKKIPIQASSKLQQADVKASVLIPDSCDVFESLSEGIRYGYFVEALDNATGKVFTSDTVSSIQDQSLPPVTEVIDFSVTPEGFVNLYWEFKPDLISYVDRYIIWRREVSPNPFDFEVIATLPFFPISDLMPINYYPTVAESGQSIYSDRDVKITSLPDILHNTTMIKTAMEDRWADTANLISFYLETPAYIYIAFDQRATEEPVWLDRQFMTTRQPLPTDKNPQGRLRIWKSRAVFPAGKVSLGGNFAELLKPPKDQPDMYVIFIEPVDETLPFASGGLIKYSDFVGQENDLKTFKYRVEAIDAAGNVSQGEISPPIVVDLQGRCRPAITEWFEFDNGNGLKFQQGFTNKICIKNPENDPNCLGIRNSDSLRFQAARGAIDLFESKDIQKTGVEFFDTGWLGINDLAPDYCYEFSLLPSGKDADFVNGKKYFYRVQAKDLHGNLSAWSDTVSAIQDAFPPDDITALRVSTRTFDDGANGCIELNWNAAQDLVSGVKSYIIYRGDSIGENVVIDNTDARSTSYCDSLLKIGENKIVYYKIGSIDNVGNIRAADESQRMVQLRALLGPSIQMDAPGAIVCSDGLPGIKSDSVAIFWENFNATEARGYEIEIRNPDNSKTAKFINNANASRVVCPLDAGDGKYGIRVRAFYANGDSTLFSNTLAIRKKTALQSVRNLTAFHDTQPTGNIILTWSHPDAEAIDEYQIFSWQEGQTPPNIPQQILPGDSTRWIHRFGEDSLVVYQCYNYKVKAVDCFGLISESEVLVSQYSNRAPTFDATLIEIQDDRITVHWHRPTPRKKANDNFEARVLVYRDSLNSEPIDSLTIFNATTFTLLNPEPKHNYFFQVQETILDDLQQSCSTSFRSAFSTPLVVPFKNPPASVNFEVQVLPIHPDSTTGSAFVSWQRPADESIHSFLIKWSTEGFADSLFVQESDTLLITALDASKIYSFEVIAIDALNQRSPSGMKTAVRFAPRWVFTPKILNPGRHCFRDSLTVEWTWVDENLTPTHLTFGADSVIVQISIDPNFVFKTSIRRLGLRKSFAFNRKADYPFANRQNSTLYLRIRGQDKWGHLSPWSNEYAELGAFAASYDDIPPASVSVSIDSIKAPIFGQPGEVNVHLSWPDADDNCSGSWYYEIVRNDTVIARDTSNVNVHTFVDRRIRTGNEFLSTAWQVRAVDSVGNRQEVADAGTVDLLLTAPDSAACSNDSTFCWSPAGSNVPNLNVTYFIEGARFPSLFGNPVSNITAGPLSTRCYNFRVPWENIHWRVKARVGNFESAWSDTFSCALISGQHLTDIEEQESESLPEEFALQQNYPNPFNPATSIHFAIPKSRAGSTQVRISIFNIAGQKIRTLVDEIKQPGRYAVTWDGRDDFGRQVSSGVYIYHMRAQEGFVSSQKMILLK